jgi:glycosyltransferase involved in cell wall biosynthesis
MTLMNHPFLSIIVCTYNRPDFLMDCIQSIVKQLISGVEILIVDNFGDIKIQEKVNHFKSLDINIQYLFEKNKGLSNARNRGYIEAKGDWVLYLDDDAIAFDSLLDRVKDLIQLNTFDCIGGMYYAKYKNGKPKWVSENYGTNKLFSTALSECPYYIPHGCVVLYRKSFLMKLNGFSNQFGMKGKQFGYAEETELQYRMANAGGKIGFDPNLKIWHFVHEYRLTALNMIKLNFALGRGHRFDCDIPVLLRFKLLVFSFVGLFIKRIPEALFKFVFIKDYQWQRAIIYIFGPTSYHLGRF